MLRATGSFRREIQKLLADVLECILKDMLARLAIVGRNDMLTVDEIVRSCIICRGVS